jgi:pSer/pThr/pTyr-binding forkhead associated (FHA) protein
LIFALSDKATNMAQIVFRHLSGARASEVDVVELGAHRELILGRATSAAVRFDPRADREVGRYHARIVPAKESQLMLADLASANGTFLNGQRVDEPVALRGGDVIQLGESGPRVEVLIELVAVPGDSA